MQKQLRNLLLASGFALTAISASAAPVSEQITDARQESQIWTTYALSPYLRANDLSVTVHAGKATLTGKVEESVDKELAKQIALGVSGITDVDNQIVVEAGYVPAKRDPAKRSFGDVVDDASITSAVKSKLLWSKHADGMTTDVDTHDGRVTLKGEAGTSAAKDLAGRLARNTRGVRSVDNQLVVQGPAGRPKASDQAKASVREGGQDVADSWITAKVKSTYVYSRNVNGADISVITNDGVVTLAGKVDTGAERELAIELAKNIRGVKNVHAKGLTHL